MRWLAVVPIVLVVAGCGGTAPVSTEDASATAASLAGRALENAGYTNTVTGAECVRSEGDRFECVVQSTDSLPVAGTLTCDNDRCAWKPD